jgi:prepilin-type N-terminal cleavage/methylation domain-containing protein
MKRSAFTLIELLISIAVLGVILVLASTYFSSSVQITRLVYAQTEMQEELRSAGQLITAEVQRALYVFPPCGVYTPPKFNTVTPNPVFNTACPVVVAGDDASKVKVFWSKFTLGTDGAYSLTGPTGSAAWVVGKDPNAPILAMISPPRNPTIQCAVNNVGGGCYQFIAYYPILRSAATATSTDFTSEKLEPESDNNNKWVIMEYIRNFTSAANPLVTNAITQANGVVVSNTVVSGVARFQDVRWDLVGCVKAAPIDPCQGLPISPTADPSAPALSRVPAIRKGELNAVAIATFMQMMKKTVDVQINSPTPIPARILADHINPVTGFQIEYTTNPNRIDERGIVEVRLKMQAANGNNLVPAQPLEFFASPRAISPGETTPLQ